MSNTFHDFIRSHGFDPKPEIHAGKFIRFGRKNSVSAKLFDDGLAGYLHDWRTGESVEVINLHTIKPLDVDAIVASISKTGCAVTAEEHNVIGGMGDAVAQVAAKHCPVPIEYIGTQDTFGESGTPNQLLAKYGLDTPNIVAAAKKVLGRKK